MDILEEVVAVVPMVATAVTIRLHLPMEVLLLVPL
jgi:hypothetical protein